MPSAWRYRPPNFGVGRARVEEADILPRMAVYVAGGGEFNRDTNYITTRIAADGRDG